MIRSLLKVALLTISASSNSVLLQPKNKIKDIEINTTAPKKNREYITDIQYGVYDLNNTTSIDKLDDETDTRTKAVLSTGYYRATKQYATIDTWVLNCYTYSVDEGEAYFEDNVRGMPFFMYLYRITPTPGYAINVDELGGTAWCYQALENKTITLDMTWAWSYNSYMENYCKTVGSYFNTPTSNLNATQPFTYKNNLYSSILVNGTQHGFLENRYFNTNSTINITESFYTSDNEFYITQTCYVLVMIEYWRANQNDQITVDERYAILSAPPTGSSQANFYMQGDVYEIGQLTYEIIDVPNIMFTIVSMPFTFFSKAFNLTLFPNTPYAVNIGNILLSIIAMLAFIIILKLILKLKG